MTDELRTQSGGVDLAGDAINIGGYLFGRYKIISAGRDIVQGDQIVVNIQRLVQQAATAAQEAAAQHEVETQLLAQGIAAYAQRLQAIAQTKDTGRNPYRGLLEYRLTDAGVFLGRERATHRLLDVLARDRLTILHAESGAGKTSLLQAGIAPRLIANGDLYVRVRPYTGTPVAPQTLIKRAFVSDLSQMPQLAAAPLRDFLRRVTDILFSQAAANRLYIFLDQFEEVFTQLDAATRQSLVDELADCLDDPSLDVRWVLALRAEYFGHLATFSPRIRQPFANQYRLEVLTRDEAREIIALPAKRVGLTYEASLLDRLLDDLGQTAIAPPQLQLVCSALFEELEPGETTLTIDIYEREGSTRGILRSYLERVLARDLQPDQRPAARRLLEALITHDARRAIRSRSALILELQPLNLTPQQIDNLIGQLLNSRLLRSHDTDDGPAYELAHDYLLSEISLDPQTQARKAAQELLVQGVWVYGRYQRLLSAEHLSIIEPYLGELTLSPTEQQLIASSQTEAQRVRLAAIRRQRRITQISIGAAVVFLILAGIAIAAGLRAEYQARQARAGQLATEAQAALERYPVRSVLLAAEGLSLTLRAGDSVHPAENALRQALGTIGGRGLIDYANAITSLAISRDSRWLMACEETTSVDEKAHLWDMAAPGQPIEQPLPAEARCPAAFSPDGRWLFTALAAGSLARWDLSDLTQPPISPAQVCARGLPRFIAISGDNRYVIAAAGTDLQPCIWPFDNLAAKPIALPDESTWLSDLVTSADGRWLVTSSMEHVMYVYDLRQIDTRREPLILSGFESIIPHALISGDSHWLAIEDFGAIKLYDLTQSPLTITRILSGTTISDVAISHDGAWVIAADHQGALTQWNLIDPSLPPVRVAGSGQGVGRLVLGPGSLELLVTNRALGVNDRAASLMQLWSTNPLFASAEQRVLRGHESAVTAAAFSPNFRWFVTGSADGLIRWWPSSLTLDTNSSALTPFNYSDWLRGQDLLSPDRRWLISVDDLWDLAADDPLSARHQLIGTTGFMRFTATSADSHWLATLRDTAIQVWDLTAPDLPPVQTVDIPHIDRFAAAAAISNDRRWLATAVTETVWLYDLSISTNSQLRVLAAHSADTTSLAFGPDNRWLLSSSRASNIAGNDAPTLILWDMTTAPDLSPLVLLRSRGDVPQAQFSADGRWLAARVSDPSGPEVRVWDLKSTDFPPDPVHLSVANTALNVFALTSDAAAIALGGADNQVYVFRREDNTAVYQEPIVLQGHTDQLISAAFSADGRQLVTGSLDRTIRLWNLAEPQRAPKIFYGLMSPAQAVAMSANGHWVISGSSGGLHLWSIDPSRLPARACEIAGRDISAAEWNQYFPDEVRRPACP